MNTNFYDGIGTDVSTAKTSEEAIVAGGLDWEVITTPTIIQVHDADGNTMLVPMPFTYTNFRSDNKAILGLVGDKYRKIQNRTSATVMDAIMDTTKGTFVAAGCHGSGERIFLLAKVPGELNVIGTNDKIEKYLMLTASHDGKSSLVMGFLPIHSVSRAVFGLSHRGFNDKVTVRHTSSQEKNLQEGIRVLKLADDYFSGLETKFNALAGVPFTEDMFNNVLDEILPIPEDAVRTKRTENNREKVRDLFNNSKTITSNPSIKDTALAALYACVEYADHGKTFTAHKDKSSAAQNRFLSVTEGTSYNLKNNAFTAIMTEAGV